MEDSEAQEVLRVILNQWTRSKHDQNLVLKFEEPFADPFAENTREEWLHEMDVAGEVVKECCSGMHECLIN